MAAKEQVESSPAEVSTGEGPLVASELDERTHAEMLMLYRECADSVRFAKSQQWTTTGGTLAIFVALGFLYEVSPRWGIMPKAITVVSILTSIAAIYSLAIYHFWQATERAKISHISSRFSTALRFVRAFTSPREVNIHRYILLFFMIAAIVVANVLLIIFVAPRP